MSQKVTVRFQAEIDNSLGDGEVTNFEYFLKDLLKTAVMPALNAEIIIGSLEVKKARE